MKKLLPAFALMLLASSAYADRTYECSRYVGGKPTGGHVDVKASSKSEAEAKALAKYRDMNMKVDSVNCK